jgi:RimJ/RimL family protein N-acetyltransferase
MVIINNLSKIFSKLMVTAKDFKKTAYHHYGKSSFPLIKFIYYSLIRVNTFYIVENDLTKELPKHTLDNDYRVMKPSLEELERIRNGKDLPREFYYDKIYNVKTCYLAFKGDELAYIHWVLLKGDYNRFLILRDGVAELNYNTTLKKFRGNKLMVKMLAYICEDLKRGGYLKVVGVVHELNPPSLNAAESVGFRRVRKIRTLGPFNRRITI